MKVVIKANIIFDFNLDTKKFNVLDKRYPININNIQSFIKSGNYEIEMIEPYLSSDFEPLIIIKEKLKNG